MTETEPKSVEKPSSIRPAIIIDETVLNGELDIIRHLLTGLTDLSDQAAVVCPNGQAYDFLFDGQYSFMIHPAYKLPFLWKQNRIILQNKLADFKPDIIHCFSAKKSSITHTIAKQLNIPYVVSVESLNAKPHFCDKYCRAVICASQSIYNSLSKRKGKMSDRLKQVNYSTYVEDTCSCFDNSAELTSMILVSKFTDLKRLEPLLNAIKHLAIDGYEFIFFMIGAGKIEMKLRRLLKSLGLSNIVNVVPPMNPLREILKEGDIFVQAEQNNSFNPYMLEAMSVGMAVASCKGGVDDLVIKDETAAIFDQTDELSIYSTIQQLLDKREKARQMARNAQHHLRENYSVSKMVHSLLEIYKNAKDDFKNNVSKPT